MTTYDLHQHMPTTPYRGDCRPGLAVDDRDLLAEARDEDACVGAALEATSLLYPPIHLSPGCRVLTITN